MGKTNDFMASEVPAIMKASTSAAPLKVRWNGVDLLRTIRWNGFDMMRSFIFGSEAQAAFLPVHYGDSAGLHPGSETR